VVASVGRGAAEVLGVARDLIVNRKIHAVYRYALPALAVWQLFMVQLWMHPPEW